MSIGGSGHIPSGGLHISLLLLHAWLQFCVGCMLDSIVIGIILIVDVQERQ